MGNHAYVGVEQIMRQGQDELEIDLRPASMELKFGKTRITLQAADIGPRWIARKLLEDLQAAMTKTKDGKTAGPGQLVWCMNRDGRVLVAIVRQCCTMALCEDGRTVEVDRTFKEKPICQISSTSPDNLSEDSP